MQADELGIVSTLQRRAKAFAERHPALRRHFQGKGPDVSNAKETHISADCRTGLTTIHASVDLARHQAEVQRRSDQLVKEAIERAAQIRAERLLAEEPGYSRQSNPSITIREIFCAVVAGTGFSYDELIGPRRSRPVSRARHILFWLIRELRPDLSLPAIGRIIGKRDHTTIMAGVERFHKVRDQQPTKGWLEHPAIAELAGRVSE